MNHIALSTSQEVTDYESPVCVGLKWASGNGSDCVWES